MIERSSDLEIFARSDIREESLALEEYPPIERNPIVPRIASIVMTTISSTRVNHLKSFRDGLGLAVFLVWLIKKS